MSRHLGPLFIRSGRIFGLLTLLAACPTAGFGAPSFDCKRANTPVEHLICSNDTLAAQDRDQAALYQRLRRAASPTGAALLLTRQRAFLASRADCLNAMYAHDQDYQINCLTRLYLEPATSLEARFRQFGQLMLETRESVRHISRLRVTESESHPWLTGSPASSVTAFNRFVSIRCDLAKGMFAAAPIELDAKPQGDTQYDRSFEIHHMDGKLISIEMFVHHESYFGHGWRSEFALNWDLMHNRPIKIESLFRPDGDWRGVVISHVRTWLREDGSFGDPESVADLANPDDDEGWLFDVDGAVLLIGRGERSMVGTSADVPIPYDVLAPFLRPDAPLPVHASP